LASKYKLKKEENYRLTDLLFVFLLDFLPAERFPFLVAAFLAFLAVFRLLVRTAGSSTTLCFCLYHVSDELHLTICGTNQLLLATFLQFVSNVIVYFSFSKHSCSWIYNFTNKQNVTSFFVLYYENKGMVCPKWYWG